MPRHDFDALEEVYSYVQWESPPEKEEANNSQTVEKVEGDKSKSSANNSEVLNVRKRRTLLPLPPKKKKPETQNNSKSAEMYKGYRQMKQNKANDQKYGGHVYDKHKQFHIVVGQTMCHSENESEPEPASMEVESEMEFGGSYVDKYTESGTEYGTQADNHCRVGTFVGFENQFFFEANRDADYFLRPQINQPTEMNVDAAPSRKENVPIVNKAVDDFKRAENKLAEERKMHHQEEIKEQIKQQIIIEEQQQQPQQKLMFHDNPNYRLQQEYLRQQKRQYELYKAMEEEEEMKRLKKLRKMQIKKKLRMIEKHNNSKQEKLKRLKKRKMMQKLSEYALLRECEANKENEYDVMPSLVKERAHLQMANKSVPVKMVQQTEDKCVQTVDLRNKKETTSDITSGPHRDNKKPISMKNVKNVESDKPDAIKPAAKLGDTVKSVLLDKTLNSATLTGVTAAATNLSLIHI